MNNGLFISIIISSSYHQFMFEVTIIPLGISTVAVSEAMWKTWISVHRQVQNTKAKKKNVVCWTSNKIFHLPRRIVLCAYSLLKWNWCKVSTPKWLWMKKTNQDLQIKEYWGIFSESYLCYSDVRQKGDRVVLYQITGSERHTLL